MNAQIDQWGNSLAIRLPDQIVEELKLKADDALSFSIVDGKLVLEPVPALPEFTLDELLDQVIEQPESEVDWGQPVGKEMW
ncbi:MAG: AbrB/MazE/SpoVT family DNA-binding domain-containing protein [Cyanobacteria bacterium P01_F01_bin.150]